MLQATRSTVNTNCPIGSYASYKGNVHMIVSFTPETGMVQIINPLQGNGKLHVKLTNVHFTDLPKATGVELNGSEFLVTSKGCIISLTTGRVVYESHIDNHRIALLAACFNSLTITDLIHSLTQGE